VKKAAISSSVAPERKEANTSIELPLWYKHPLSLPSLVSLILVQCAQKELLCMDLTTSTLTDLPFSARRYCARL
jgi:hypothetical protein